ncbi:MAG: hypothetical protein QXZ44_06830 [Ferroplasma sp.]
MSFQIFQINETYSILYDSKLDGVDLRKLILNDELKIDINIPEKPAGQSLNVIFNPSLITAKIKNGLININNINYGNSYNGVIQFIFRNSNTQEALQDNFNEFLRYTMVLQGIKNVLHYEMHLSGLINRKYNKFDNSNIESIKTINHPQNFGFKIFNEGTDKNLLNGQIRIINVEPYVADTGKTQIDFLYRVSEQLTKSFFSKTMEDLRYIINNYTGDK